MIEFAVYLKNQTVRESCQFMLATAGDRHYKVLAYRGCSNGRKETLKLL